MTKQLSQANTAIVAAPAVLTSAEMLALDARTIAELGVSSPVLMERASLGVTEAIRARWPQAQRVVVLCGPGNNGADGIVVARQLCQAGLQVTIATSEEHLNVAARAQEVSAKMLPIARCDIVTETERLSALLAEADVWVDALLGVGSTGRPRGFIDTALRACSVARREHTRVIAVDVPTGVEVDNGQRYERALDADVTVTFEHRKPCHLLAPGCDAAGEVAVHAIGLLPPNQSAARWVDRTLARSLWRSLPGSAHKGTRGHLLVIAGSAGTFGAALLCASAALRSGAGLVTVGCPDPPPALVAQRPELMWRERSEVTRDLSRFNAVVLGPGAGVDEDAAASFEAWYNAEHRPPSVLDADALTWLARTGRTLSPRDIITPHPGELARLLHRPLEHVLHRLPRCADDAYAALGATVVAKTAGAWIRGERLHAVGAGHPGMGTAGSGDVLAGITGAMLLRHPPMAAATLGAWIHARAGAEAGRVKGAESLIASDIVDALPSAFAQLQGAT